MAQVATEQVEQVIARHITRLKFEDLPADAVRATKEHILHTVGTVLAGSAAPGCPELVDTLEEFGGRPESTILGWGIRVPAVHAAFANSAMGHAQEFDNNDDRIAYKSSVCAVPGALAVAERVGAISGKELLAATCLGIDLGIRMGLSILPQPAHPVAPQLGPFAAAASAAKLLGLDEDQIWDALGIAAGGVSVLGGGISSISYSKRLSAGVAARNGVFAAVLASKGFRARMDVFATYFRTIHRKDGDLSVLVNDLGERFEVVNVGPKAYPTCRYTHGPIDAALALTAAHDLKPDDVTEVRVTVGRRDYGTVFGGDNGQDVKRRPLSVVDAQFSIPYTVATAITQRRVFLQDMTEEAIKTPGVLALAQRVVPVLDPGYDEWPADVKPCLVEIQTRSGASYSQRVEYPKGNPRNPVAHEEIRRNFVDFASWSARPPSTKNVEQARDFIENLEDVPNVSRIAELLSPA